MNPARVAPTNATPVLCSAMVTKCQNASSHAAPHRNAAFLLSSDAARSSFPNVSPGGRRFSSPCSAETRLRVKPNGSSRVVISDAPPLLARRRKHAASAHMACATNSAATREKRARLISLGVGALPRSLVSVSSIRMHGWYPPHTNAVDSNKNSGGIADRISDRRRRVVGIPRSSFAPRFSFISATSTRRRASPRPSARRPRHEAPSAGDARVNRDTALPEKRPSLSRRHPACSLRAPSFETCERRRSGAERDWVVVDRTRSAPPVDSRRAGFGFTLDPTAVPIFFYHASRGI